MLLAGFSETIVFILQLFHKPQVIFNSLRVANISERAVKFIIKNTAKPRLYAVYKHAFFVFGNSSDAGFKGKNSF